MNTLTRAAASAAAAALVCACQPSTPEVGAPTEPTVGTVNGQPLFESWTEAYSQSRLRKPIDQINDDEKSRMMDDLVQMVLLAQEAERQGLDKESELAGQLALQRLSLLAQGMLKAHVDANPITEEAVRARFDEEGDVSAKEYKARHILVETEEQAREVIAQLQGGADFVELAKEKSTGPSGPRGGDLGWFQKDRMVKPFADAVASMEAGTFTTVPVQTQFGWHVILAEESRSVPFTQAQERLRGQLRREAVDSFIKNLKDTATVELLP